MLYSATKATLQVSFLFFFVTKKKKEEQMKTHNAIFFKQCVYVIWQYDIKCVVDSKAVCRCSATPKSRAVGRLWELIFSKAGFLVWNIKPWLMGPTWLHGAALARRHTGMIANSSEDVTVKPPSLFRLNFQRDKATWWPDNTEVGWFAITHSGDASQLVDTDSFNGSQKSCFFLDR